MEVSVMKISVLIPAFNSARTIGITLDCVLKQTVTPDEILVLDDGSTDETSSIAASYGPRVTVLRQENQGAAKARNALVARATGDLVAFVDADDIWHPKYLEVQKSLFLRHPDAAAFFSGHTDFSGYGRYDWGNAQSAGTPVDPQILNPLTFLAQYNEGTGRFGSMSFLCLPRRAFAELGSEPFRLNGVEDSYLCTSLPLLGRSIIVTSVPLVAYRVHGESLSSDHSRTFGDWVRVFELLDDAYRRKADARLRRAFRLAHASKRRQYAKLLMGRSRVGQARRQLVQSLGNSVNPRSMAKSLALLSLTFLPAPCQPVWPVSYRSFNNTGQSIATQKNDYANIGRKQQDPRTV